MEFNDFKVKAQAFDKPHKWVFGLPTLVYVDGQAKAALMTEYGGCESALVCVIPETVCRFVIESPIGDVYVNDILKNKITGESFAVCFGEYREAHGCDYHLGFYLLNLANQEKVQMGLLVWDNFERDGNLYDSE